MSASRISSRESAAVLFARKLNRLCVLEQDDEDLIASVVRNGRVVSAGASIAVPLRGMGLVVSSGCAAELRLFADGRRQATSVALPGEMLRSDANPFRNDAPVALTDLEVVDLAALTDALEQDPERYVNLRCALLLTEKLEAARLVEQVVSLGARSGLARMAYWLIDLHHRLALTDMKDGDSFQLPFAQNVASFMLGMSIVHVARVNKQLKDLGVTEIRNGRVIVLSARRLKDLADYQPFVLRPEEYARVRAGLQRPEPAGRLTGAA